MTTEGKLNLPDDILSSKFAEDRSSVKDQAWGGRSATDEKTASIFSDESKDQLGSDNNALPLSPQWLYVKQPVDAKPGGMRAPNSSSDAVVKDDWRLDGSQEKKDWRRSGMDGEGGRRWREEERDTGLLGRRERRKEDHRSDGVSTRDTSDGRGLSPPSDRWSENSNRSSVNGLRRDNKWSSRWGPEDKEKDSRNEKRTGAEKEDAHSDKQSVVSGSLTTSDRENDSREKWRPRHRLELHGGASAAHRSPAPGFGSERGRMEATYVGFAGRGKCNNNGSLQISRDASASPIGSVPSGKNHAYCYPRAKLLDIYRKKNTLPSFSDSIPEEMKLASPITQEVDVKPLAFFSPDGEEEAVLRQMWIGKITNCGGLHSVWDTNDTSDNNSSGFGEGKKRSSDKTDIVEPFGKLTIASYPDNVAEVSGLSVAEGHCKDGEQSESFSLKPADLDSNDFSRALGSASGNNILEFKDTANQQVADLNFLKHPQLENIESSASLWIGNQLPDDSSSLFGFMPVQQDPNNTQFSMDNSGEGPQMGNCIPPEELSLCYLDPQGTIQGPYLGIDIITWFEQGYFGTDLPVRFSDIPDGSPFYELGEVMPQLKIKAGSASSSVTELQPSDVSGGSLDKSTLAPAPVREDQQWARLDSQAVNGRSIESNHGCLSGIQSYEEQRFQNSVAQDEEIIFPGRPGSSGDNLLTRHNIHSFASSPSSHLSLANEFSKPGMGLHQDENAHPFGLLMSELIGNSNLKHTQPSKMSSGVGDQGHHIDPLLRWDTAFVNQGSFGSVADKAPYMELWPDHFGRNTATNPSIQLGDTNHLSLRERELNDLELQHLMIQKFQKEQVRQPNPSLPHHPLSNAAGLGVDQIPAHLLELQLQRQRQLELQQQQHQLELQQQQWQLDLQQQRQLELQQQQSQLELQQQQSQLELQQQRQLELQQQQRQLEFQHEHRLMQQQQQQQQLRDYELKLLHQQQQQQQQQMLLEQFLRHQVSDLGYSPLKVDPMGENLLDQIQFRMQQNSVPSRHLGPSLEQFINSQFGHGASQEPQVDFLSQMKPSNILPAAQELCIQQEQLQAQQLSLALRQHLGMEGKRHFSGSWSVDDGGLGHHRSHATGFNSSDSSQQPQRLSARGENLGHLNWNHALQEQQHHVSHELSSVPFEGQLSLPAVASGMKLNHVNSQIQASNVAERNLYLQSADRSGSFSSGMPTLPQQVSEDSYTSHSEDVHRYLSGNNEQIENSWVEKVMQQLQPQAEQQINVSEGAATSSIWQSAEDNEEIPGRVFVDFHQKLGGHSTQALEDEYRAHFPSNSQEVWPLAELLSSKTTFNHRPDEDAVMNNVFRGGSQNLNLSFLLQDNLDGVARSNQSNHLGNGERLTHRSKSGALEQTYLSSTKDPSHTTESSLVGEFSVNTNQPELNGNAKRCGSESLIAIGGPVSQIEDNLGEQAESNWDFDELTINANSRRSSRHSSITRTGGSGGLYSNEMGLDKSSGEVVSTDRLPSIVNKGLDGGLHRRPPVSRALSSHDVLSDSASTSHLKQKKLTNHSTSDERRHESMGNLAGSSTSEMHASGWKEVSFRRSASYNDAAASETSFVDALKKPVISEADAAANLSMWESGDGSSQGAQNSKKKAKRGKKGKQIDPALLGFKISSNRIMMGEIQGLDD